MLSYYKRFAGVTKNIRWALKIAWDTSPKALIAVISGYILRGLLPAGLAWAGRGIVDAIVAVVAHETTGLNGILFWIMVALVLALVNEVMEGATQFNERQLRTLLQLRIDQDILLHAATLDISQFEDSEFQDVLDRAKSSAGLRFSAFLNNSISLISKLLQIGSLSIVLLAIDPVIVIVIVPLVVPYGLYRWQYARRRYDKENARATKRRRTAYFVSMLTSASTFPEIKLLNLGPVFIDRYTKLAKEFANEEHKLDRYEFTFSTLNAVALTVAFYLLFIRIAYLVTIGQRTVGDVALFTAATTRLRSTLIGIATSAGSLVEEALYINNLETFFQTKPRLQDPTPGIILNKPRGEIVLDNVSFRYPGTDQPVISNLSLHIAPGETIALVGENGAGKTTLLKLLMRLYDPDAGRILFDGIDLREISVENLRRQFAFVLQNFNHYEATAHDNIAFGDWEFITSRDQVEKTAELAGADNIIASLPDGYDTVLGRMFGSTDLSGGQWRRLANARAFTRTVPVFLLDEPTSNLDARGEFEMFQHLRELTRGRTAVLISHRFSTVTMADRIVVLQTGTIIESGAHNSLIEQGGLYAELYDLHQRQMSLYEIDEKP